MFFQQLSLEKSKLTKLKKKITIKSNFSTEEFLKQIIKHFFKLD